MRNIIGLILILVVGVISSLIYEFQTVSTENKPMIDESLDKIKLIAQFEGVEQEIAFHGDGEKYYYFFPSGCKTSDIIVKTKNGITLRKKGDFESLRKEYEDGENLEYISWEEEYLLGCKDKSNYLYEVPVVFVRSANMNSTYIETDKNEFQKAMKDKTIKIPGKIQTYNSKGETLYKGNLDFLKGRGNATWKFSSDKKPLHIKLEEEANLLGLGTSEEFNLLSQELDGTFMHNKIAFDIAKKSNLKYTPDCEYTDLWINGEYYGLYLLTDSVNIRKGSVDITNLEEKTKLKNKDPLNTYKQVLTVDGNTTYSYDIPNNPKDISGGYLIEVDNVYSMQKKSMFVSDENLGIAIKSPTYTSKEQMEYIKDFVLNAESAIQTKDEKKYEQYIDVESWAKMGVIQEVLGNNDFMSTSQFFYKDIDKNGNQSLLYAGPVWDMDYSIEFMKDRVVLMSFRAWYKDLYQNPTFKKQVENLYVKEYKPLIEKWIQKDIDRLAKEIEPAAHMNFIRWSSVLSSDKNPIDPFEEKVSEMKSVLQERIQFFDKLWIQKIPFNKVTVIKGYNHRYEIYMFYQKGEKFVLPDAPRKINNLKFLGWYHGTPENPGEKVKPDEKVDGDWVIHAKYIEEKE